MGGGACRPPLLALQQLPVGGDLDVQGQFEVHQLLVLADLSGQILLGPPQGLLQLGDITAGLFQLPVALCPGLVDLPLQGLLLAGTVEVQVGGWRSTSAPAGLASARRTFLSWASRSAFSLWMWRTKSATSLFKSRTSCSRCPALRSMVSIWEGGSMTLRRF